MGTLANKVPDHTNPIRVLPHLAPTANAGVCCRPPPAGCVDASLSPHARALRDPAPAAIGVAGRAWPGAGAGAAGGYTRLPRAGRISPVRSLGSAVSPLSRNAAQTWAELLAPRYWPVWAGLALLWLVSRLPYRTALALGRGLGRLLYRLLPGRRDVARRNLELCFPECSAERREQTVRAHFESIGMGLIEVGLGWWTPARRLTALGELHGLEHFREALARGKGVLMVSAHFTSLDICAPMLRAHIDFDLMYRAHENPVIERAMARHRNRLARRAIPRHDMRGLIRSLRDGHAVWYAPDQNYRGKYGALVPFFSIPAPTNTGTSRIARMSGAAVVPFFMERKPAGGGYLMRFLPALTDFPSDDPVADTARINRLIEEQVRRVPAQYWWVHRRFKRRPPGYPDVYA